MKIEQHVTQKIWRDALVSILLYLAPIALMFVTFHLTDHKPWTISNGLPFKVPAFIEGVFQNLSSWGLPVIILAIGVVEFAAGLYETKWTKNERILDIVCFVIPKIIIPPVVAYYSLQLLPQWLPGAKNSFSWVPFWWAFAIIAVADDLTQYWYHRLHHQVPWLWRFHRTHHSAPYMGMAMAGRQNVIYTIFFSQTYLTVALTYMGLGYAALFVKVVKSLIVTGAHSSIPWDKPFYLIKWLNPIGWVLERFISTPATHYAHHADTTDDGVGHYKGNFGNMFFLWDIIFGTGIITRRYPSSFGIKHYKEEEWYAQFLWPIFKSKKEGSELSADGPMVGDQVPVKQIQIEPLLETKAAS
ncbi:sterol desaturase family protein [Dyadobacter psychrophilus]|uniref:Sterol desaturase/sphingolipid hydroxylase, fatty acid hydroxylase superfamily n=1 Tax=Dyadobacter psychrophilus TaxID=651661 RepID=A0A1T5F5F7_9BACT|nr:sterol desaturase family protein [Dyadobacter psychrophilus]SKB91379.1 Sterol desaturase/sphingolipid hydroxylase, fatty acid hydroxylase superfamily [Dyadobacter psychrophilus]